MNTRTPCVGNTVSVMTDHPCIHWLNVRVSEIPYVGETSLTDALGQRDMCRLWDPVQAIYFFFFFFFFLKLEKFFVVPRQYRPIIK